MKQLYYTSCYWFGNNRKRYIYYNVEAGFPARSFIKDTGDFGTVEMQGSKDIFDHAIVFNSQEQAVIEELIKPGQVESENQTKKSDAAALKVDPKETLAEEKKRLEAENEAYKKVIAAAMTGGKDTGRDKLPLWKYLLIMLFTNMQAKKDKNASSAKSKGRSWTAIGEATKMPREMMMVQERQIKAG